MCAWAIHYVHTDSGACAVLLLRAGVFVWTEGSGPFWTKGLRALLCCERGAVERFGGKA